MSDILANYNKSNSLCTWKRVAIESGWPNTNTFTFVDEPPSSWRGVVKYSILLSESMPLTSPIYTHTHTLMKIIPSMNYSNWQWWLRSSGTQIDFYCLLQNTSNLVKVCACSFVVLTNKTSNLVSVGLCCA